MSDFKDFRICEACNGSGIRTEYRLINNGKNRLIKTRKCLICNGSGVQYAASYAH